MSVIGPARRGVLVVTPDPDLARRDLDWLESAGFAAAFPGELGFRLKRPAASAAAWARALRRPVVESLGDDEVRVARAETGDTHSRAEALDAVGDAVGNDAPRRVAVFGGAWVSEDEPEYSEAVRFGRRLAEAGIEVITGGYQGIMAAASRGAARAGSRGVIGVTIEPWSERVPVNDWLTHDVEARDLLARLPLICDADAWVAFPGGVGTLSEVALCWSLVQTDSVTPRPLVIVGERWDRALRQFRELLMAEDVHFDLVRPAETADRAFDVLRTELGWS